MKIADITDASAARCVPHFFVVGYDTRKGVFQFLLYIVLVCSCMTTMGGSTVSYVRERRISSITAHNLSKAVETSFPPIAVVIMGGYTVGTPNFTAKTS